MNSLQRGFALLEFTIAIALASLAAGWAASFWMQQAEDAAAQATGSWLLTVKHAVDQMLIRQADALAGIMPRPPQPDLYRNLFAPTLAELKAAGHLPTGFPLGPPLSFAVSILIMPPQGDCEKRGCRLEGLAVAQPEGHALSRDADVTRLGKMLMALEGVGLSIHPLFPSRLKGAVADFPNPPVAGVGPFGVGSIAAFSVFDTTQHAQFVRHGEVRETALRGPFTVKDQISAQAGLRTPASIQAGGRISAGEFLQIQGLAHVSQPCEADGLVARSGEGQLLSCHQGTWRAAGSGFGGAFGWQAGLDCRSAVDRHVMINPVTGDCTCPAGFTPFEVSRRTALGDAPDTFRSYICIR